MRSASKKRNKLADSTIVRRTSVFLLFVFLSFAYLYPAHTPLLTGSEREYLGDGTDPTVAPFLFSLLTDVFREDPTRVLYGAVATPQVSAPEGTAIWFTYLERLVYLPFSWLVPPEQATSFLVFFFFLLNALIFYGMAREFKWTTWLALAGALAWAFNAYTHTRAKVHFGFVAIYLIPLTYWALSRIRSEKSWFSWFAAVAFLGVAISAQYYIIMLVFLSPFFLWYLLAGSGNLAPARRRLTVAVLSALPAILLLTLTLLKPVPSGVIDPSQIYPRTGESETGLHPFLSRFAAHPVDYLTGEFGLGLADINPLRSWLSEWAMENIGDSNYHERTNGIRWSILGTLLVFGFLLICRKVKLKEKGDKIFLVSLLSLALAAFLMSLPPDWWGLPLGPSGWIHQVVSQFRVPSRAGIFVHFALLVAAGTLILRFVKPKYHFLAFLIVLVELPPFLNPLPVMAVQPKYESLQIRSPEECGTGLYFPYVSNQWGLLEYYTFLQRMRGSHCPFINANGPMERENLIMERFPLHGQVIHMIDSDHAQFRMAMLGFMKCSDLSWIVFDRNVNPGWRKRFCDQLGWNMPEPDVCRSPRPLPLQAPFRDACLKL